jgi:hypothetical protein
MCESWGKGSHLGSRGARPARRGKRRAVGFEQWRRIDIARWLKTRETGSPHLQETVMHRVIVIVDCVAVIHYNHNRYRVLLYYLFQENKSFGTIYHLHSSSDVREVVSSTLPIHSTAPTTLLKFTFCPHFPPILPNFTLRLHISPTLPTYIPS